MDRLSHRQKAKSQPKLLWALVTSSFPWPLAGNFLNIWIGLRRQPGTLHAALLLQGQHGRRAEGGRDSHDCTGDETTTATAAAAAPPADAARKSRRKDTNLALKVLLMLAMPICQLLNSF
uniref:Uncharacterized protein n=1 Tax=Oryza punctata TaxID=4537 RepID=A0A0E0L212_ORYPU